MTPGTAAEPRNAYDEKWAGPNPSTADDLCWFQYTGMCGGCGAEDCHDGPCTERPCRDPWYGYDRLLCDRCPTRIAQGFWSN